jgi:hypothetical protein
MHPERQGHRFDGAKQRDLRNVGMIPPRLARLEGDLMERPENQERRPGKKI